MLEAGGIGRLPIDFEHASIARYAVAVLPAS